MDNALWSVLSNLSYVIPLVVAVRLREWLRALLFLLVGAASAWHHTCQSYPARCGATLARHVRRTDHVIAGLAIHSVLLLLVPLGTDAASRRFELRLHVPAAIGLGVAASLVIDTSLEDVVYIIVQAAALALAALAVRCYNQHSTLALCGQKARSCVRGEVAERVWSAVFLIAVVLAATFYIWFNSDWSSREPYHGSWHVGTALAAALILVLIARKPLAIAQNRSSASEDDKLVALCSLFSRRHGP